MTLGTNKAGLTFGLLSEGIEAIVATCMHSTCYIIALGFLQCMPTNADEENSRMQKEADQKVRTYTFTSS